MLSVGYPCKKSHIQNNSHHSGYRRSQTDHGPVSYTHLVEIARRKKFYMKKADSEHSHVGGLASRLTVLKEGDLENTDRCV